MPQHPEATKLAIFMGSLRGGGAEKVMINLASGFIGHGFTVDLVLSNAIGPYRNIVPDRVRIVDLHAPRVLRSIPRLARYLRQANPDAMLVAQDHTNIAALLAAKLARTATRIIVSVHTTLSVSSRSSPWWRKIIFFLQFGQSIPQRVISFWFPRPQRKIS